MIAAIFVICLPVLLYYLVTQVAPPEQRPQLALVIIVSYALRILINVFVSRDIVFFSHGIAGGDSISYEMYGGLIAQIWNTSGIHFVDATEITELGAATLPPNLFAVVIYLNQGHTLIGCVAVVAFVACLSCLEMYRFTLDLGGTKEGAMKIMTLFIFSPSFVYHTSDTYKDGLNAFFVLIALTTSVRCAKNFTVGRMLMLIPCLWALWYVRYYMVFFCLVPVTIGLYGRTSVSRIPRIAAIVAIIGVLVIAGGTVVRRVSTTMQTTFDVATNENTRDWNFESGASGVTFDDGGSPWGALGPKLIYTIASPFPWQVGTLGLQLGKLDGFVWYFLMYRAFLGARRMWRHDRSTLIMLLVFILPTTVAYATTMSNIGLIVRQRMPIVMITATLAALSYTSRRLTLGSPVSRAPGSGMRALSPAVATASDTVRARVQAGST